MRNTPGYVGGLVVEFSLVTWDTGFNTKPMRKKKEKVHTQIIGVFSESLDKRPTSFPLHWCSYPQADDTYKFVHFLPHKYICISSVQFSHSVMSNSLRPHELQHTKSPCPSPTPGVYSNSCPSSQWCHPAISSSVVPFSSCPQPLPALGFFPVSQLFLSGGQSIGVSASASVLPTTTRDRSPLEWTGWISLQSKGLSRVFSITP